MPSHEQHARSNRDSWPPTQMRLRPTTPKRYPSLDDIDEDPLTYFLTPTPDVEDAGHNQMNEDFDDDVDMHLDAGIESPRHAKDIVRSVSPSSLEGLAIPSGKGKAVARHHVEGRHGSPPVPELSDPATPDSDSDEEEYIRFAPPRRLSLPRFDRWKREKSFGGSFGQAASPTTEADSNNVTASEALLPSPSFSLAVGSPPRGRSRSAPTPLAAGQVGHRVGGQTALSKRRPNRLWREPSPDVWSIEEETEEEGDTGAQREGNSVVYRQTDESTGTQPVTDLLPAAKSQKRVRFLLPAEVI